MLDHIALPYGDLKSFDDLPTPFRAVATDLRKGDVVVLDRPPLSRAMRATMSIPGVFAPVNWDDWLLVDGGVLNNIPADVARSSAPTSSSPSTSAPTSATRSSRRVALCAAGQDHRHDDDDEHPPLARVGGPHHRPRPQGTDLDVVAGESTTSPTAAMRPPGGGCQAAGLRDHRRRARRLPGGPPGAPPAGAGSPDRDHVPTAGHADFAPR